MSKGHRIHTVDVFAEKPLAGNQLAVVLDAADIPGETMQRIAKEMNISASSVYRCKKKMGAAKPAGASASAGSSTTTAPSSSHKK